MLLLAPPATAAARTNVSQYAPAAVADYFLRLPLPLDLFAALGQPLTAILVLCLIWAPFWPSIVVGIVRGFGAEAAVAPAERGVRALGEVQLEERIGASGTEAKVLLVMPFLMRGCPRSDRRARPRPAGSRRGRGTPRRRGRRDTRGR